MMVGRSPQLQVCCRGAQEIQGVIYGLHHNDTNLIVILERRTLCRFNNPLCHMQPMHWNPMA